MLNEHSHSTEQHLGEGDGGNGENSPPSSPSMDEENSYETKKVGGEEKKTGRRKINIEFIEDKSRRHITFSKRKAGIMKKAYELSTLTGTQVLLLVASETGHVYTFATPKLQPLITKPEGKNLIQSCLNAPEATSVAPPAQHHQPRIQGSYNEPPPMMYPTSDLREAPIGSEVGYDEDKKETKSSYPLGMDMNSYAASAYPNMGVPSYGMPSMVGSAGIPRGYMPPQYAQTAHSGYSTSSGAVQGTYAQSQSQQYPSAYGGMHGLPNWKGAGMQSMPMNQMGQGQGSQATSPSISGLIQASKQNDHADHS